MSDARFEALIAAYGGDPGRWPAAERGLAAGRADRLREAAAVDRLLAAHRLAGPEAALVGRVLAARPCGRLLTGRWWSGLGLAATALGGLLAGATAVSAAAPALTGIQAVAQADNEATIFDTEAGQ